MQNSAPRNIPLRGRLIPTWPAFNKSSTNDQSHKAVSDIGIILDSIKNPSLTIELASLEQSIGCYKALYSLTEYLHTLRTGGRPVRDPMKEHIARRLPGFNDGSLDRALCQILGELSRILIQEDTTEEERGSMPEERIKVLAHRLYTPTRRMRRLAVIAKILLEDYSLSTWDMVRFSTYVLETHVKIFTEPTPSSHRGKSLWYDRVREDEATTVDPMALLIEAWNEERFV